MTLTQYIRDSVTHELDLTWPLGGAAFSPDGDWALIFTAKRRATAPDVSALIQKASGAGITVGGSTASVAIVPADTTGLTATETFLCDVQAQHVLTGEVRTVWVGRLQCILDITRETTTSIPVHTTEPPLPFSNIAQSTHAAASKTTPVDADEIPLADSAASWALKKLTWANLKATLKSYLDAFYQAVLVSGTNLKTINGTSLLGAGDLSVGGDVTSVAGRTGDVTLASADIVDASSLGSASTAGKAALYGGDGQISAPYFFAAGFPDIPNATYGISSIATLDAYGNPAATMNFPTTGSGTLMLNSNNLSDLSSASTARTNLGLGTGGSPQFTAISVGSTNEGLFNTFSTLAFRQGGATRGLIDSLNLRLFVGLGFSAAGSADSGMSRLGVASLAVGNGTPGNTSGTLTLANLTASGTVSAANLSLTNPLSLANGGTGGTDASTARTNLGLGSAADLRSILGIQVKVGTSTGLSSVGVTNITGLTGFTLEADTTYKLELHYLWTSASSNFQIEFVTTGSFYRGGSTPALGQAMTNSGAFSTSFLVNDTTFHLRGSVGESRTNMPHFGYAVFKTNTSGTGKLQLNLLSGSTLSTITSSVAMLTKMS